MTPRRHPLNLAAAPLMLVLLLPPARAADEPLSFEKHARPILNAYCLDCHGGGAKPRGGLDLRLRRFAVSGGKSGPALVPGQPDASLLLQRVKAGEMPPGEKKLPPEQAAVLERWIAAGAPTARPEPDTLPPGLGITAEERGSWFFQPLTRPPLPAVSPTDRIRTPIDTFILARLQARGLAFNPDADRRTLIRRATLDLTGLPPTPDEVEHFAADPSDRAYESLIDRLLASPHYGERWARHWLDVAGHADSDGDGTADTPRPHAWKYRDWVVRALNADLPLDRFLTAQLAGDELVPPPWTNLTPDHIDLLTATGFLRTAPDLTSSGGGEAEAQQVVADTLKIVSSSLLGLTVGCAQCHDHRYDPVPQDDYYRLRAVFEPALDPSRWRRPAERRVSLYTDADRAKAAAVEAEAAKLQGDLNVRQARYVREAFEKELAKFPDAQRAALQTAFDTPAAQRTDEHKKLVASHPKLNVTPGVLYQYNPAAAEEIKKLQAQVAAKRAEKPVEDFLAVTSETPGPLPVTHIFHRGDHRQPKDAVGPGDLSIAAPDGARLDIPAKDPVRPTAGRRLAFARHLTTGTHPLLGRVLANRLWLHHFSQGLVDTPGDFGALGRKPTHPDLIDWLACELPRQSWSLKAMHRLVMTSTVYRQSSRRTPAQDALDSANDLYARYPLHRLEAEAIRDGWLAAAGRLDRTPHGPPIPVTQDALGQASPAADRPRRSLYLQVRRTQPVSLLAAFDAPASELNCDRRRATTSAPQALVLMNGDFLLQQSAALARRLQIDAPASRAGQVARAWRIAYQRLPTPEEAELAARFLDRPRSGADPALAALTDLCQQLLASNEFLYVD